MHCLLHLLFKTVNALSFKGKKKGKLPTPFKTANNNNSMQINENTIKVALSISYNSTIQWVVLMANAIAELPYIG